MPWKTFWIKNKPPSPTHNRKERQKLKIPLLIQVSWHKNSPHAAKTACG